VARLEREVPVTGTAGAGGASYGNGWSGRCQLRERLEPGRVSYVERVEPEAPVTWHDWSRTRQLRERLEPEAPVTGTTEAGRASYVARLERDAPVMGTGPRENRSFTWNGWSGRRQLRGTTGAGGSSYGDD
jgi:hypothetical protein